MADSYFNNNVIFSREGDGPLSGFKNNGNDIDVEFVRMQGYVIMPVEKWRGDKESTFDKIKRKVIGLFK